MRRSANFNLMNPPESVQPVLPVTRRFYVETWRVQAEATSAAKAIAADRDLTPEAKQRRRAELHEKTRSRVEAAYADVEKAVGEVQAAIAREVGKAMEVRSPFTPLPRDVDPATRALAERQEAVARMMATEQADRLLEKALGDRTGQALAQTLVDAAATEDPLVLHVLETRGLERVRRAGSQAQREVFEYAVREAREARLGEGHKLLLDHHDALGEVLMLATAVLGDARSERFLDDHAPGLKASVACLGQLAMPWGA